MNEENTGWHKHKQQADSSKEDPISQDATENEMRLFGKALGKNIVAKEEEKLGRKLTPEEKQVLFKKTIKELLQGATDDKDN